jgi:hypothetical protein
MQAFIGRRVSEYPAYHHAGGPTVPTVNTHARRKSHTLRRVFRLLNSAARLSWKRGSWDL